MQWPHSQYSLRCWPHKLKYLLRDMYGTALQTRHHTTRVRTYTSTKNTVCCTSQKEFQSVRKKKVSSIHTSILTGSIHPFFLNDLYLIQSTNILNTEPRPCFSLLLWLLHSQLTTAVQDRQQSAAWALACRQRWWPLSQLQRSPGFWKKG